MLEWVRTPHDECLYLWTSISQTAVNLAANMGAKNIVLIGCDNCSLGGNHHAQSQHTLWKGADPNDRYMQYYEGLREVRTALRYRKVNVLALTPFLKLDNPELDFKALCEEESKELFIHNHDIFKGISLREHNRRYINMTKTIIRQNINGLKRYLKRRLLAR
jgi:hypothetical protein